MNKIKPRKKRGKWFYALCIIGALWVVGVLIKVAENRKPPPRPKSTEAEQKPVQKTTEIVKKSAQKATTTAKTQSYRPPPPKPGGTQIKNMKFPKHYIDLNEVKKHPQLHGEMEVLAYWYRYNQSAAGYYHKKPKKAREYYLKFLSYKSTLGEERFYEVMNLADSDYPF